MDVGVGMEQDTESGGWNVDEGMAGKRGKGGEEKEERRGGSGKRGREGDSSMKKYWRIEKKPRLKT